MAARRFRLTSQTPCKASRIERTADALIRATLDKPGPWTERDARRCRRWWIEVSDDETRIAAKMQSDQWEYIKHNRYPSAVRCRRGDFRTEREIIRDIIKRTGKRVETERQAADATAKPYKTWKARWGAIERARAASKGLAAAVARSERWAAIEREADKQR